MGDKKTVTTGEFRELKPGKILCIAGKTYKGNSIKKTQDKKSKEKKEIPVKSTCFVPELLIKEYEIPEWNFVGGKDKPKPGIEKQ